MTWLQRTPRAVVLAHIKMLGPLTAQESMLRAAQVSVGDGLDGDFRKDQWDAWREAASHFERRFLRRPLSSAQRAAQLAAAGIGFRIVEKKRHG